MNRSHLLASKGAASIFSALAAVLMFCTAVGIAAPDSTALGTGAPTSGSAASGTPAATAPGSPTSASPPGAGVPGAHQAAPRPSSASSPPPDALDRGTPRDAVAGFLEASGRGDYKRAAEYLDVSRLPRDVRGQDAPALARQLRIVLDQAVPIDLESLSDQPEGSLDDKLPVNRELLATVAGKTSSTPLTLQRVPGEGDARIWKFSTATVAQIPRLYRDFGYGPLGAYLPPFFFELRFLDLALWQWLGLLLLIILASAGAWVVAVAALAISRPLARRTLARLDDRLLGMVAAPLRLAAGVLLFAIGSGALGLSIPARQFFGAMEKALVIVIAAWLVVRAIDVLGDLAAEHLHRQAHSAALGVVPLGRKTTKVVVVALGLLAVLQNVGINVTGVLAGLGIGGLAIALAAQKTVENLFGGVALILDQPVRVGDFCRFGDKVGTVEEIGLRSTRVRTLDRTVVSVPNLEFSSLQIENFMARDRIWLHATLGLRYETTPDQLRYVLVEVRKMLYAHPRIAAGPRIRFVNFGAHSLDLEIFAYVLTSDGDEFLAVQEDVYLRIIDIVAASGTGLAFPSQVTYVARDPGVDLRKREAAEAQVREWRRARTLYLPEFPKEAVAELDDTLPYPPPGAPAAKSA